MTHLKIQLSTTQQEIVPDGVIKNLANLTRSNTLDATSNIEGNIHCQYAYGEDIALLNDSWNNLHTSCTTEYIKFKDPAAEALVKGYLGKDGITTVDLANIASMHTGNTDSWFKSDDVEYFDEYKYFTGVHRHTGTSDAGIDDIYYGLAQVPNLKRVTFPKGNYTLSQTGALYLFNGNAKNLEYVDWNGNTALWIPLNLYRNCESLKYSPGIIPLGATKVLVSAFEGCSSLEKMIFYEGFTEFLTAVFSRCTSLKYVEYPSTTTTFSLSLSFNQAGNPIVVMKAVTPPNVTEANSPGNYTLYVPDGSVDAYKAAEGWKDNASNIFALSTLPLEYRDMGTVTLEDIDRT